MNDDTFFTDLFFFASSFARDFPFFFSVCVSLHHSGIISSAPRLFQRLLLVLIHSFFLPFLFLPLFSWVHLWTHSQIQHRQQTLIALRRAALPAKPDISDFCLLTTTCSCSQTISII
uniref:(northern house mosquito) hypothetical protein n=1 Tax=Culex pipiens TaxID=7175 RepID=A0A8D8C462_CULPI